MRTFKALAALLEYPTEELVAALSEIEVAIENERLLKGGDLEALEPLFDYLADTELLDAQENYVALFDRGRSTALNLFEHVHGETRDRGQAMVDLMNLYASHGLLLDTSQLPDYLPLFLEYLSLRPLDEARASLADTAHILASIGAALAGRNSPYAGVLRALLRLAGERHPEKIYHDAKPAEDNSAEAIDREWMDEPVTFLGNCSPPQAATSVVHFFPSPPAPLPQGERGAL